MLALYYPYKRTLLVAVNNTVFRNFQMPKVIGSPVQAMVGVGFIVIPLINFLQG